jgi:hypothetical protein
MGLASAAGIKLAILTWRRPAFGAFNAEDLLQGGISGLHAGIMRYRSCRSMSKTAQCDESALGRCRRRKFMNSLLYPPGVMLVEVLLKLLLARSRYKITFPASCWLNRKSVVCLTLRWFFQQQPLFPWFVNSNAGVNGAGSHHGRQQPACQMALSPGTPVRDKYLQK